MSLASRILAVWQDDTRNAQEVFQALSGEGVTTTLNSVRSTMSALRKASRQPAARTSLPPAKSDQSDWPPEVLEDDDPETCHLDYSPEHDPNHPKFLGAYPQLIHRYKT